MKTHKAKKSLGQNFLKSVPALNKIIEAGEITKDDVILEIGPGKGALTTKLLEKAGVVIAVEKDRDLLELLKEKFQKEINNGSLVLVHDDILEFDVLPYVGLMAKYKVIANIPYNITGAILKKFLTEENQPKLMVLMVQNEVAKRIVAIRQAQGKLKTKESILSISVKAYGEPKLVMKVPARYFSPAPKVDSAVIQIKNISRKIFKENKINEEKFWKIIHAGFAHKRKMLLSNLTELSARQDLARVFEELVISEKIRAEDLKLSDWISITKKL